MSTLHPYQTTLAEVGWNIMSRESYCLYEPNVISILDGYDYEFNGLTLKDLFERHVSYLEETYNAEVTGFLADYEKQIRILLRANDESK